MRLPALKSVPPQRPGKPINTGFPAHDPPRAVFASYMSGGLIHVGFDNRCAFVFPATQVEPLAHARAVDLRQVWIDAGGRELHWPRLAVRVALPALMRGDFGSPEWMQRIRRQGAMPSGAVPTAMRKSRVPATQTES